MAKRKIKLGDDFFFEKIEKSLRDIYDEERTDIPGMLDNIKKSTKDFESEFTTTEKMVFMERFYSYSEGVLNNKIFFLFKTVGGVSPAYAITSLPLKPRKPKTVQVTHIGFNKTWYAIEDFCEIFMEELQESFKSMKLVTGVDLKSHIYAAVSYD